MWSYRIVNMDQDSEEEPSFEIREVYFDREGNPYGHCAAEVFGGDLEEMDRVLAHMKEALDKPILNKADFTGDPNV